MPLAADLSDLRDRLQGELFPSIAREVGPLGEKLERFVTVLELAPVCAFLVACPGLPGRPPSDRAALARAFVVAKRASGMTPSPCSASPIRDS